MWILDFCMNHLFISVLLSDYMQKLNTKHSKHKVQVKSFGEINKYKVKKEMDSQRDPQNQSLRVSREY